LEAKTDTVAFVGAGADVFNFSAANIDVQLNLSTGDNNPVVNFAASFPNSEELTLFDTNSDKKITLGELKTLNDALAEPVPALSDAATFTSLTGLTYDNTTVINHDSLVKILDQNGDGQIDVAEAAVLLNLAANSATLTTADGNRNGII